MAEIWPSAKMCRSLFSTKMPWFVWMEFGNRVEKQMMRVTENFNPIWGLKERLEGSKGAEFDD